MTAALLARYALTSGSAFSVTLDVTFTTTPAPRARNCGSTACVTAIVPIVLVSNSARTVSSGKSSAGAAAPAELLPLDTVRALFDTNTIGTIAVTQAVLPQFRARGAGVVVNVTSSVTLKALPLVSAYRASKAAVNAYTESMAVELEPFGVRTHLVLPGRAPDTRFADNARGNMHGFEHEAYADFVAKAVARMLDASGPITHAQDVAEAVWRAATDPSSPMRIPAGADAQAWAAEAG